MSGQITADRERLEVAEVTAPYMSTSHRPTCPAVLPYGQECTCGALRRRWAAERFRTMWRDLQRFATGLARELLAQEAASIDACADVDDTVALAAAEDELDRHKDLRETLQSGFVDRLLELRKFAADNDLVEPVAYIDSKLARIPRGES
jgi:hypothetical protein